MPFLPPNQQRQSTVVKTFVYKLSFVSALTRHTLTYTPPTKRLNDVDKQAQTPFTL